MSAAARIAWRELRAQRVLISAALVLGLVPLLAHLVPGLSREDAGGIRDTFALFLGVAVPIGAAIAVGASLTSRDIAERRLGFYLARPVAAAALWSGKVVAGAVLVALAVMLVALPTMIASGWLAERIGGLHRGGPLVFAPQFLLCVMAGANLVAASYRMGSWLFAANAGLLAAGGALFVHDVRRLTYFGGAPFLFAESLPYVFGLGAVALLAPSAAQIAIGRSDPERGHRALSATLWGLLGAALLGFHLWVGWLLGVTPAEVGHGGWPVLAAPRGSAFFFEGPGTGRGGYKAPFLMDGQTGAYLRLTPKDEWLKTTNRWSATLPKFAPDGRLAVWAAGEYWREGRGALVTADFGSGAPVVTEHAVEDAMSVAAVSQGGEALVLLTTDAGRFTGVGATSGVAIVDIASGRVRARTEAPAVEAGVFLSSGEVRLFQRPGPALAVVDWNPAHGTHVERTRIPGGVLLAWRGDSALIATRDHWILLDAAGREAATFAGTSPNSQALFLSDGRLALHVDNEVRIASADGRALASVALDGRTRVQGLRESAPGELEIGLWGLALDSRRTLFVDAGTGAVLREAKGLLPALWRGPEQVPADPGSFATRLYTDAEGALVELQGDGNRRVIVPAVE